MLISCEGTISSSGSATKVIVANGTMTNPLGSEIPIYLGAVFELPLVNLPGWIATMHESLSKGNPTGLTPFVGSVLFQEESSRVPLWLFQPETIRRALYASFSVRVAVNPARMDDWDMNLRIRELTLDEVSRKGVEGRVTREPDLILPKENFKRNL